MAHADDCKYSQYEDRGTDFLIVAEGAQNVSRHKEHVRQKSRVQKTSAKLIYQNCNRRVYCTLYVEKVVSHLCS